jgi:hypothetical protein
MAYLDTYQADPNIPHGVVCANCGQSYGRHRGRVCPTVPLPPPGGALPTYTTSEVWLNARYPGNYAPLGPVVTAPPLTQPAPAKQPVHGSTYAAIWHAPLFRVLRALPQVYLNGAPTVAHDMQTYTGVVMAPADVPLYSFADPEEVDEMVADGRAVEFSRVLDLYINDEGVATRCRDTRGNEHTLRFELGGAPLGRESVWKLKP